MLLASCASFCLLFSGPGNVEVVAICFLYNSYVVINVHDGKKCKLRPTTLLVILPSLALGVQRCKRCAPSVITSIPPSSFSVAFGGMGLRSINLLLVKSCSYWSNGLALPFVAPLVYTWR